MTDESAGSVDPDRALNDAARGHVDRDWQVWAASHFFRATAELPRDATRAWMSREKLNYRGIGQQRALRHVIAAKVDQPFLEDLGQLDELERLELEGPV